MTQERRKRRGTNLGDALSFQLAACVEDEALGGMVLADADGLPVAHWGDMDACSEAAARAVMPDGDGHRVMFGGIELYVCALGGQPAARRRSIDRSARGVVRILGDWIVSS